MRRQSTGLRRRLSLSPLALISMNRNNSPGHASSPGRQPSEAVCWTLMRMGGADDLLTVMPRTTFPLHPPPFTRAFSSRQGGSSSGSTSKPFAAFEARDVDTEQLTHGYWNDDVDMPYDGSSSMDEGWAGSDESLAAGLSELAQLSPEEREQLLRDEWR